MIQSNSIHNEQKEGSNIQNIQNDDYNSSENQEFIIIDESAENMENKSSQDSNEESDNNDDGFSVFVGGLTKGIDSKDLKTHFGQYGPVSNIKIGKSNKTKKKLGFAFVTFHNRESYLKAINTSRHKVKKTSLRVEKVISTESAIKKRESQQKRKIFIKGLPKQTRRKELLAYIEKLGQVEDLVLQHTYKNGKWVFKQFGFIVMRYKEDYDKLIRIGKLPYGNKTLKLEPAKLKGQKFKNVANSDEKRSLEAGEHSIRNENEMRRSRRSKRSRASEEYFEDGRRYRYNLCKGNMQSKFVKLALLQIRLKTRPNFNKPVIKAKKTFRTTPENLNHLILCNQNHLEKSSSLWGHCFLALNK